MWKEIIHSSLTETMQHAGRSTPFLTKLEVRQLLWCFCAQPYLMPMQSMLTSAVTCRYSNTKAYKPHPSAITQTQSSMHTSSSTRSELYIGKGHGHQHTTILYSYSYYHYY